jgi:hypothetical protein
MIKSEEFTKDLTFDLFYKIMDSIAIYECSFFGIVSVQIEVKRKPMIFDKIIS